MRTNQPSDSSKLYQLKRRLEGIKSESLIAERIGRILDDRFILLRNQQLPGQWGDIDQILIGPPGIRVIEIKDYIGLYRASGEEWIRVAGEGEQSAESNPIRQALANASRLRQLLRRNGITADGEIVRPWVVLANRKTNVQLDNPAVYIVFPSHLEQEICKWAQAPGVILDAAQVNAIAGMLGYRQNVIAESRPVALGPSPQAQNAQTKTAPTSAAATPAPRFVSRPSASMRYLRRALLALILLLSVCACGLFLGSVFTMLQSAGLVTITKSQVQSDPSVTQLDDLNVDLRLIEAQSSDAYQDNTGTQIKPASGSQFIWVHVTAQVMNRPGKSNLLPPAMDFSLLTAGQEIRPSVYLGARPGYLAYQGNRAAKPGEKEDGWIVFQLPTKFRNDAIQLRLKTIASLFSTPKTYTWDIGQ